MSIPTEVTQFQQSFNWKLSANFQVAPTSPTDITNLSSLSHFGPHFFVHTFREERLFVTCLHSANSNTFLTHHHTNPNPHNLKRLTRLSKNLTMSKQVPTYPTNPNTAEHGCGNGFSLTSALACRVPAPPVSSTVIIDGRPNISRTRLLAIIDDALTIVNGDFEDVPMPSAPAFRAQ